ncbi:hypothetical protein F7725_000734 [Dissostichus mawsoni]|uniref:Uncharacterized protein n=1 Tax=Dissostichus mawsoni TaxID=36200 RepID=A0A7J5ZHK8_DISMA|nr:hypothetical protein F7725_000734 [Dissostichus mawsoni]
MDRPPAGSHSGTNRECQSHHRHYQHKLLAERENKRERRDLVCEAWRLNLEIYQLLSLNYSQGLRSAQGARGCNSDQPPVKVAVSSSARSVRRGLRQKRAAHPLQCNMRRADVQQAHSSSLRVQKALKAGQRLISALAYLGLYLIRERARPSQSEIAEFTES